ncbi:glycosyltransferase family 2 protein [Luteibacter aegosomatissinici]|uniref:glycosyltransferase family 2 protein n=1 Tax=Luteibacter aegosomatissinici TaxID=2911539 RepID=UPI001FF97AC1|nr:glycosyltransferase [Luteibacter aegosomatissinici]UPG95679.1 glycosyltransferase [Luteibacter aegosomatissinici]
MPFITAIIPVYKEPTRALRTVLGLLACDRGPHELEIVVVDDGSGDDTAEQLRVDLKGRARVVAHNSNRGRVEARNTGMREAQGELLLFLDADCVPVDRGYLIAHAAQVGPGRCSSGVVRTTGTDFWAKYQRRAAARRLRAAGVATFTSANVMMARDDAMAVGGFDPAYRGYGFEDRDFALRLTAAGVNIAFNTGAVVTHEAPLDLSTVCAKMADAGGANSRLFSQRHPAPYAALGYASLDARMHPWLRAIHPFTEPVRRFVLRRGDGLLQTSRLPFRLRALLAGIMSGLSFLHGSADDASRIASNASR